jgi:hypothetical protein
MKDYLRIATIMESNVHSNRKLVNMLKTQIANIENTTYYSTLQCAIDNVDNEIDIEKSKHSMKTRDVFREFRSNGYIFDSNFFLRIIPFLLKVVFIFFLCSLIFVGILAVLSDFASADFDFKKLLSNGISTNTTLIIFSLITIIVLAIIYRKVRVKIYERRAFKQRAVNKQNLKYSNELQERNSTKLQYYKAQFKLAEDALSVSLNRLNSLYSENILPLQYRNFTAVATMYEWASSGRCIAVYGHGGLYDTYEYHRQMGTIITKLEEINNKLDCINSNQDILIDEVRKGNDLAQKTYQSIEKISNVQKEMASDISKIKVNDELNNYYLRQQLAWTQVQTYNQIYH